MVLILAESISIDGGLVAILLAILFAITAAVIAAMVAGVIWAKRAAHGSSAALAGFVVVASAEAVLAAATFKSSGSFLAMVFGIAFFVHIGLYLQERTKAGGGDSTDEDPPTAQ